MPASALPPGCHWPADIPAEWRELLLLIPNYDAIASAGDGVWFDAEAAQLALDFFPECLTHVEGDLMGQPFELQPWQKSFIANLFGWKMHDEVGRVVRRYREALLYVPRKNGKMLALDTPIPGRHGWTTMGDLAPGDVILDEFRQPCTVLQVHPIDPAPSSFALCFSNGDRIRACADHLWLTTWAGESRLRTTQEIFETASHLVSAPHLGQPVQIDWVKKIDPTPMRCITVDSPNGLYLCGRSMLPTHNTPLVAGIAALVFFTDEEQGQQDYIAASDKEQAGMLFRQLKGMVEAEPELGDRCRIFGGSSKAGQNKSLVRNEDNSYLSVISADAHGKHGRNIHLAIIDELHEQKDRELVDTIQTSFASLNRPQPLLICLTTADYDRPSICNHKLDYAKKVAQASMPGAPRNAIPNRRFLPVVYELPRSADWRDEKNWAACNPNLGVSVSLEYLRGECQRAQTEIGYENTFRRLHLNQKTSAAEALIAMHVWDACEGSYDAGELVFTPLGIAARAQVLRDREVHAALDIGATSDFTALILLFPHDDAEEVEIPVLPGEEKLAQKTDENMREIMHDEPAPAQVPVASNAAPMTRTIVRRSYTLLPVFWLPEEPVKRDVNMMADIEAWRKLGFIRTTPGNVVDYDVVNEDIIKILEPFSLVDFAFDRGFQGGQMGTNLMKTYGDKVIAFPQGILSMAAPFREFLELLPVKRLHHDGNPVMRWMVGNVVAERRGGLIKPSKDKSTEKIDGVTSACMAIGRALFAVANQPRSVYDNRGITVI